MPRFRKKLPGWVQSLAGASESPKPTYVPLKSKGCFRLLRIPEMSGDWELRDFTLKRCPKYITLSYSWKSPLLNEESAGAYNDINENFYVYVNGNLKMIPIPKNLDEALGMIFAHRARSSLDIPKYIWVDSICINQQDISEREVQVAIMGEIYSNCEMGLVWLGMDDTYLREFLDLHAWLEPVIREKARLEVGTGRLLNSNWTLHDLETALRRSIDLRFWASYVKFYETRRWFTRVWVAQEVALPRETTVLCGNEIFPWERTQIVANFLRDSLTIDLQSLRAVHYERPPGYEIATMSRLKNFVKLVRQPAASQDLGALGPLLSDRTGATTRKELNYSVLHECLTTVRSLEATCEHDKLYGVLGIFNKICGQELDDLIRPAYGMTIQEVSTRLAWLLMRELPSLCVLSSVEDASQRQLSGLPSWVPDWTSAISNNSLVSMLNPESNASIVSKGYQGYREATSSVLCLKGAPFDTVSKLAESPQASWESDAYTKLQGPVIFLGSVFDLCMSSKIAKVEGQSTWEMLWRTMIGNQTSSLGGSEAAAGYFIDYITKVLGLHKANLKEDLYYKNTLQQLQRFQKLNGISQPTETIIKFVAAMQEDDTRVDEAEGVEIGYRAFSRLSVMLNIRRRLFRTCNGHLGIGPLSMEKGDQVWLMDGAHYPLLLRPIQGKNTFTFIGDLYLHGHMNGEMLQGDIRDRFGLVSIE